MSHINPAFDPENAYEEDYEEDIEDKEAIAMEEGDRRFDEMRDMELLASR